MTPDEQRVAAQRRNALVMGLLLGAMIVLIFVFALAKIGLRQG